MPPTGRRSREASPHSDRSNRLPLLAPVSGPASYSTIVDASGRPDSGSLVLFGDLGSPGQALGSQSSAGAPSSAHTGGVVMSSTQDSLPVASAAPQRPSATPPSSAPATPRRSSPLNSGVWITLELVVILSQVTATIIVLALSTDEHPDAPLAIWLLGYAIGCTTTLPVLWWRYRNRLGMPPRATNAQPSQQEQAAVQQPGSSNSLPMQRTTPAVASLTRPASIRRAEMSAAAFLRCHLMVERLKIALDCFFAVWFVVGNVWLFGGHASSSDAPNLYTLTVIFLALMCLGYAMPFILCATICCCLPCIIAVMGLTEEPLAGKGAPQDLIMALPTYKFKAANGRRSLSMGKGRRRSNAESDDESPPANGGTLAAGTANERLVSSEDALCCICLGQYKDGVQLRELPCSHHFHTPCVDTWLKINASCPLCKLELVAPREEAEATTTEQGQASGGGAQSSAFSSAQATAGAELV